MLNAISKAELFLHKKFEENQFERAVWDTSVAVRALRQIGTQSDQFISERIGWLLSQKIEAVNAGPHPFCSNGYNFCGMWSRQVHS